MSQPGATVIWMVAVAWAAIGLLAATLVSSLFYLGSKIDSLDSSLNARIDALDSRLSGRLDALNSRMDGLSARMDAHLQRHPG